MTSDWPVNYPSKSALRREVQAALDAWVEVLLDRLPDGAVRGVYFKGSAQKPWDSPIDYVPELSDVDLHLLLRDDADVGLIDDTQVARAVRLAVEEAYRQRVTAPIHFPRPQLTILNRMMTEPWYLPSPKAAVTTLYGEEYPEYHYTDEDREAEVARDCWNLLEHREFLDGLPLRVIDKPGVYLVTYLRQLAWRVSPIGPRVLSVIGMRMEDAWVLNRTGVIQELRARDRTELAESYMRSYLAAWEYFVSGYTDSRAAGEALAAGIGAIQQSMALAQEKGRSPIA